MKWKSIVVMIASAIIFLVGLLMYIDAQSNEDVMVRGHWDSNPEPDMSHYIFYVWQGNSQSLWNTGAMDSIETVSHDFQVDSVMSSYLAFNKDWIKAGCVAVDSAGNRSDMAITRFYHYPEFAAPAIPSGLKLEE